MNDKYVINKNSRVVIFCSSFALHSVSFPVFHLHLFAQPIYSLIQYFTFLWVYHYKEDDEEEEEWELKESKVNTHKISINLNIICHFSICSFLPSDLTSSSSFFFLFLLHYFGFNLHLIYTFIHIHIELTWRPINKQLIRCL